MVKRFCFSLSLVSIFFTALMGPVFGIVNGMVEKADVQEKVFLILIQDPSSSKNISTFNEPDHSERCTGFAISDQWLVTAGHCVVSESLQPVVLYVVLGKESQAQKIFLKPEKVFTNFKNDYPSITAPHYPLIEGCTEGEVPLKETKSLDIAILQFPRRTFSTWFELSLENLEVTSDILSMTEHDSRKKMSFWGYGTHRSTRLFSGVLYPEVSQTLLRKGQAPLKRFGTQVAGLLSSPLEPYADAGDSGGPVVWGDKVVGVLTATDEKCETPLGEDYGLWTLFSRLDSVAFKDLLTQAKAL